MKIVIAPDSFKESLSALAVAEAVHAGFEMVLPKADYCLLPLADGGEGTARALLSARGGEWLECVVDDPLGRKVRAGYALLADGVAVIEMAEASGLHLLAEAERNPLLASSYGFGQLIVDALQRGVRRFILAIGGSATNDGGAGMLQALGVRLLDGNGQGLARGAKALLALQEVQLSPLLEAFRAADVVVACDVRNPLLGSEGATAVFAEQKGADAAMREVLERALVHYADCVARAGFSDARMVEGSGAAGGLGFALLAVCGARLQAGAPLLMDYVGLPEALKGADLVVTGEGRMDSQTLFGKLPFAVLEAARAEGVPTVAIAGGLGAGVEDLYGHGFLAVLPSVARPCSLEEAFLGARENVARTARALAALWMAGR